MRLWKCEIQHTIYVATEDDADSDDAEEVAIWEIERAISTGDLEPDTAYASEVESESQIDIAWRESIPYGDANRGGLTCEAVLLTEDGEPKPLGDAPGQLRLFDLAS